MLVRSAGFATDLIVRRLAGSEITEHVDHIVVRTPENPGFWWGNFIIVGDDYANAHRWLAAFVAAHPDAGHIAIGLDAPEADQDVSAYEAAGLDADVSTVLFASKLAEPIVLPDVVSRALVTDDDWAQELELMLACNPPEDAGEELFIQRRAAELAELSNTGNGGWFGTFVDGHLRAALGLLTDGDGLARYQSVETHPDFRRRGLARQLVATAGRALLDQGATSLVMVADPDYHAADLYRSLGFVDGDHQIQVSASGPS